MEPEYTLAEGRTAEVFAWGKDKVLKLYRRDFLSPAIEEELASARAAWAAGVPTPQAFEIIEIAERRGIVFARIEGATMLASLFAHPEQLEQHAHQLADLHIALHARAISSLPSQRRRLTHQIQSAAGLSGQAKARALEALAALPDGNALCHGDFHPDNLMLTADGPLVIDWVDATRGQPLADVARTSLLLQTAHLSLANGALAAELLAGLAQFHDGYLSRYLTSEPVALQQAKRAAIEAWRLPLAAARLAEGVSEAEARALVAMVEEA